MTEKFHRHKLENLIVVPKIITIHYLEFDRFFTYMGESHNFWELVYADSESIIATAEGVPHVLKQGEMIFHKPGEFHSLSSNQIAPPNVFVITFECRSQSMRFFEGKKLRLPKDLRPYIHNIIKEAKSTFVMNHNNPFITKMTLVPHPVPGGQQLIRLNLETFLILLLRHESQKQSSQVVFVPSESFDDAVVDQIIRHLKELVYGSLSIDELCRQLNFGKSSLYSIFKQKTGLGINQYYTKLKIDEAKKLLREQKLSLKQISETLNFSSPAYFCKVFKKTTKMTPTQYTQSVYKA